MRLLPAFALLGFTFVSAKEDSYYELGFQEYNNGKWNAGFNARPEAVHGAGMGERVKPKIGAAEHGLNREPVNHGHAGIEPKVGPVAEAKQRHQDHVQQADSRAQQNHPAQQGKAVPKPAAGAEHKGNNASGKKQQAAKPKPAPAPARQGKAQAEPAAQHRPAANTNGNHAKAGVAAKGQAGHAKGAAAGQQQGPAAHAKPAAGAKQPAQQAKQAQVQGLQFTAGAQHRVAQDAGQQASPMETPSPEPAAFGSAVQHFVVRPPGDECVATVYSTVTLVPGTTTIQQQRQRGKRSVVIGLELARTYMLQHYHNNAFPNADDNNDNEYRYDDDSLSDAHDDYHDDPDDHDHDDQLIRVDHAAPCIDKLHHQPSAVGLHGHVRHVSLCERVYLHPRWGVRMGVHRHRNADTDADALNAMRRRWLGAELISWVSFGIDSF